MSEVEGRIIAALERLQVDHDDCYRAATEGERERKIEETLNNPKHA